MTDPTSLLAEHLASGDAESAAVLQSLEGFETVVLAIASDLGGPLVSAWQAATGDADRIRCAAALSWGLPLQRAGDVLAALPDRSWRERQSLLHALVRHGDAILPALDAAFDSERTREISLRVWLELPPTEEVLARVERYQAHDAAETETRLKTEANPRVGQVKVDRTLDPRPVALRMVQAYLHAERNFTQAVLAPAHQALDAGDRSGIVAAWLLFESATVTVAADPVTSGLVEAWRPFVERTTSDLTGFVHLARALLAFPDRDALEHEGAQAIVWAGAAVDDVLVWLIHRDPPPWAVE